MRLKIASVQVAYLDYSPIRTLGNLSTLLFSKPQWNYEWIMEKGGSNYIL